MKKKTGLSGRRAFRVVAVCLLSWLGAQMTMAAEPHPEAWLQPLRPGSKPEGTDRTRWKKRWIASWIALAAVQALDVHSSRGHGEANPLFRDRSGRFAAGRATLVKSAIAGGFFASQLWILRANPRNDYYKPFTLANGVASSGLGAVVAHNYSLPRPVPKGVVTAVPAHLAPIR